MSYFNTTNAVPPVLVEYQDKAITQDVAVLAYFEGVGDVTGSPTQIHRYLMGKKWVTPEVPLTSIRRSLSNLTRRGLLERTKLKITGMYGRPEYTWRKRDGIG